MAWDNPHGTLSADERLRLEREAQIFAEAQRKMLREEQKRAERDAERSRPVSTGYSHSTPPQTIIRTVVVRPPSPEEIANENRIVMEIYHDRLAKSRAKRVLAATYGSADYIHYRYGEPAWRKTIEDYQQMYQCSKEEAIEKICQNYREEDWSAYENELVEKLIGKRK